MNYLKERLVEKGNLSTLMNYGILLLNQNLCRGHQNYSLRKSLTGFLGGQKFSIFYISQFLKSLSPLDFRAPRRLSPPVQQNFPRLIKDLRIRVKDRFLSCFTFTTVGFGGILVNCKSTVCETFQMNLFRSKVLKSDLAMFFVNVRLVILLVIHRSIIIFFLKRTTLICS